jgi:DNA segregation ATPase FtsK/SpoIIIE, S-DNA-T family
MASPLFSNPFADDRLPGASAYSPALDVPSFNQAVSDTLLGVIQRASRTRTVEARRKIYILKAGPGYGKTHLMGRIGYRCEDRALFVFVPQVEEHGSPVKHIHWHLVDSLFRAPPGQPPQLHRLLAHLCHHSFRRYFDFLPHTVKERHKGLRQRLDSDVNVAGEIVAASIEAAPFLLLADSINHRLPMLHLEVLRALVLGWSPWAAEARRWLRGEDLEDEQRATFKLPEEPPTTTRLLQTVAALIHRLGMAVVLCCDQSEALVIRPDAAVELSNSLVGWLDSIPNVVLTLSCLRDKWGDLRSNAFSSFGDRVQELEPADLNGPQAVNLVRCRLAHWPDRRPDKSPFWPFREADLLAFASRKPRSPRDMLRACAASMETWIAKQGHLKGDSEAEIDPGNAPRPIEDLFRLEWTKALEEVKKQKLSPDDVQEERLFRSVRESLEVLKLAKAPIGGLELLQVQDGALGRADKAKRLGLQLKLGVKSSVDAVAVVVALTKLNGGPKLAGFINALKGAVADPVAGAVLVRPGSELTLGPKTAARQTYDALKERGKLRPFALVEHRETFEMLECLATMLDKATQHDLQLGQKTISPAECRDLAARSQVLAGLDLVETIFGGWPQAEVVRARAETGQPTTRAESASRVAVVRDMAEHAKPAAIAASVAPSPPQPPEDGSVWAERMLRAVAAKLTEFGQRVEPLGTEVGPTFVRLKLRPLGKTSVGKVCNHANDLRTHIPGISRVPLIADQPGFISVDVERPKRQPVPLVSCLRQTVKQLDGQLAFPVGVDVSGKVHWLNLADPSTCHLLVAGTTGSGKSEFLKALVMGLATRLSPLDLRFVFIDPKRVTFNFPAGSPYLLHPVAHTVEETMPLVQECFEETERRYALLEEKGLEHVGQLTGKHALPRIVVLFDEFADLMADRESRRDLESTLKRIGALARAAGIHLVLATQRPDKDVVTPLLRANLPTRICLRVDSERNSNIILDEGGGERLLGRGDLFWKFGGGMIRLQGAFVTKDELEKALRVG